MTVRLPFARWLAQQTDRDDEVGILARTVDRPRQPLVSSANDVRRLGKRFHPEQLEPCLSPEMARPFEEAVREWVGDVNDETTAVLVEAPLSWDGTVRLAVVRCPWCHDGDRPRLHQHGLGHPGEDDPRAGLSHRGAHCFNRSSYLPDGYVISDPNHVLDEAVAS